jgi:hypothetical protein
MDFGIQLLIICGALISGAVVSAFCFKKTKEDARNFIVICMWFILFMFIAWCLSQIVAWFI